MNVMDTRWWAAAVVGLILAGCGDGGQDRPGATQDGDYGEPVAGGTATVLEAADMVLPLSMLAQGTLDGSLGGDVMFMALLAGGWEDGRLVFRTAEESPMALARRYEFLAPDSTSIRFHMRSDVRWSDGEPITAEDLAYTYGIMGDPALASPLQHYVDYLDDVEVENDSTVVFHFSRRYPDMITHSAAAAIPRHLFGDTEPGQIRDHPALRNPQNGALVVSGPYMIGLWERGQRIVLVRNPEFEPSAYLDQIVFRIVSEPTTRLVELQTGSADVVTGITLDQVPRIRSEAPHVRLEREEKRFYDYVAYNGAAFEPFADPEIRRALGLAVDAEGLIQALQMEEFAVPAGGPYAPIFRELYDPAGQAPLPFDPDEARRILESKGWADSDGDGVLDRDGQPFRFTLHTNQGNQRRADVTQILQQQWRGIGVDARIQILEFNTFTANLTNGDFEAAMGGWSVGLSPDLTPLWAPASPFNYTRYQNPEVTALIERASSAPTFETAAPIWREAASRIVQDQPYTWLYYMDSVDGVNNRLRGTLIDTYGPYQNTWEWWIPAEMQ